MFHLKFLIWCHIIHYHYVFGMRHAAKYHVHNNKLQRWKKRVDRLLEQ